MSRWENAQYLLDEMKPLGEQIEAMISEAEVRPLALNYTPPTPAWYTRSLLITHTDMFGTICRRRARASRAVHPPVRRPSGGWQWSRPFVWRCPRSRCSAS